MQALYKSILFSFLLTITSNSFSATRNIDVEDDEFDPAIMTVNVGDTLVWVWDEGIHTTTSTIIPGGAAPWNFAIDQNHTIAFYIITVPGSYDYQCDYHFSMGMLGHFIATGSTGVEDMIYETPFKVNTVARDRIDITFDSDSDYIINLISLTGEIVKENNRQLNSGTFTETIFVETLPKGIYILNISNNRKSYSKRIVIS